MTSKLRIAVLYAELSGHISACLKALARQTQSELLVVRWPPRREAPFDDAVFSWLDTIYSKPEHTPDQLSELINGFDPQVVLISGWMDKDYLRIVRKLRKLNVLVIAMIDNQWKGSVRQRVAALAAPWYLHSRIDALWVPGERQRQYARKLGYSDEKCLSNLLTCDWDRFAASFAARQWPVEGGFLYAGRYVHTKGIDVLAKAYSAYRRAVSDPLGLICAGAGEEAFRFQGIDGIDDRGFVQPDQLPDLMQRAACFVLPSRHEPWGVVVHEAATAGLPIIASDACGSADHLLQQGTNGYVFRTDDVSQLTEYMLRIHAMTTEEAIDMSRASHRLSKQYSPTKWVETLMMFVGHEIDG